MIAVLAAADGVAGVAEADEGFALACVGAVDWDDLAAAVLAAGTRSSKLEDEGSGLEVAESYCAAGGAAGGLILILLVTTLLFEYSGRLKGGGRSDINCLKYS
jgi:hypothetical protein